ncbi:MAG: hypothetical protein OXU81_02930 [Gammaproteobacteria bacterium]|nr:hypothetical protein [Gammaproteobacteria bacterium]
MTDDEAGQAAPGAGRFVEHRRHPGQRAPRLRHLRRDRELLAFVSLGPWFRETIHLSGSLDGIVLPIGVE